MMSYILVKITFFDVICTYKKEEEHINLSHFVFPAAFAWLLSVLVWSHFYLKIQH